MAKINVYCLFDKVAQSFDSPFFIHNDALACRALMDSVRKNPEGTLAIHAADYDIYVLGVFDHDTALFSSSERPEFLGGLVAGPVRVANLGDLIFSSKGE